MSLFQHSSEKTPFVDAEKQFDVLNIVIFAQKSFNYKSGAHGKRGRGPRFTPVM